MTTVIREIGQFQLIECETQKMFRTVNTILLENTKDEGVSYWFNKRTRDVLMRCSDAEFAQRCKQSCGNDINRFVQK